MNKRILASLLGLTLLTALGACSTPEETADAPFETSEPAVVETSDSETAIAPREAAEDVEMAATPVDPATEVFLSDTQRTTLEGLDIPVVLPSYVPEGFEVDAVRTAIRPTGAQYDILYTNAQNQCFAIEATSDRVEDAADSQYRIPVQPKTIGTNKEYGLNFGKVRNTDSTKNLPASALYTDWIGNGSPYYRLVGAGLVNQTYAGKSNCQDIATEEAVRVAESLTYLNPNRVSPLTIGPSEAEVN